MCPLGPNWMIWLNESGEMPNSETIIDWNMGVASDAPVQIRMFAEHYKLSDLQELLIREMAKARYEWAAYLYQNGYMKAAERYTDSAELLLDVSNGIGSAAENLEQAADYEEEAIENLRE